MLTNGDLDRLMRLGDCSIIKEMLDGASSKIEASVALCDAEAASEKIVRAGHSVGRITPLRLHAGYSYATSLRFKSVYACVRQFKNRSGAGFVHFRELA